MDLTAQEAGREGFWLEENGGKIFFPKNLKLRFSVRYLCVPFAKKSTRSRVANRAKFFEVLEKQLVASSGK